MLYCPKCRQRIDPPATTCEACGGLQGEELGVMSSSEYSSPQVEWSLELPTAELPVEELRVDEPPLEELRADESIEEEASAEEPVTAEIVAPATEDFFSDPAQELTPADEEQLAAIGSKASWKCPGCGEIVPRNFDVCWKCLTSELGEKMIKPEESVHQKVSQTVDIVDPIDEWEAEPIQRGKCTSCGSNKLIPNVRIVDRQEHGNGSLQVVIFGDPGALIFKDAYHETLTANICGECGHVELRAANPRALYQHYRASKK